MVSADFTNWLIDTTDTDENLIFAKSYISAIVDDSAYVENDRLYCTYKDVRYRIIGVSDLGHLVLSPKYNDIRNVNTVLGLFTECSDWSKISYNQDLSQMNKNIPSKITALFNVNAKQVKDETEPLFKAGESVKFFSSTGFVETIEPKNDIVDLKDLNDKIYQLYLSPSTQLGKDCHVSFWISEKQFNELAGHFIFDIVEKKWSYKDEFDIVPDFNTFFNRV